MDLGEKNDLSLRKRPHYPSCATNPNEKNLESKYQSLRVDFSEATEYYNYRLMTLDWNDYRSWLQSQRLFPRYEKRMNDLLKKYGNLGFTFQLVAMQPNREKLDILKALSKFCLYVDQRYDTILKIKFLEWLKQKGVSWKLPQRDNSFELAENIDIEPIIEKILTVKHKSKDFALFALVTGLRHSEAIRAWNEHDKICHNGIMKLFWKRRTKKANAVFCHSEIHKKINFQINESMIKRHLKQNDIGCRFNVLRKINYTIIAENFNEPLAKFMQGRTGDISQRLYYLPMMKTHQKKWQKIWDKKLRSSFGNEQ